MSFLDNLENTLKNMESGLEQDPQSLQRAAAEREELRKAAIAAAPHAEQLKNSKWTQEFLGACMAIGHGMRTRVGMVWIGDALRLDAKEKRLELRPGASGVDAVSMVDGVETGRERVDFEKPATDLATRWLQS